MPTMNTSEKIGFMSPIKVLDKDGNPAAVDGPIVWKSSNEEVMKPMPNVDGTDGFWESVGPGTAIPTLEADADTGAGVETITKQLEDITVSLFAPKAESFSVEFATPVKK